MIEDPDCLLPFGASATAIGKLRGHDFLSAKVGYESSMLAGTSIGKSQLMSVILGMGVTSISVIVRPREIAMGGHHRGRLPA